ncbi:MAG: hypothetical protein JNJ73_00365 [Hyphomonadaceae bacterium]|nr:hypothetical protein [Hyphomonadaceae bacterium]
MLLRSLLMSCALVAAAASPALAGPVIGTATPEFQLRFDGVRVSQDVALLVEGHNQFDAMICNVSTEARAVGTYSTAGGLPATQTIPIGACVMVFAAKSLNLRRTAGANEWTANVVLRERRM